MDDGDGSTLADLDDALVGASPGPGYGRSEPGGNGGMFVLRDETAPRRPLPMKFGAIDVGTNSIHLLMAEISPEGDFVVLGRDKDMVRLGRGGFSRHVLTVEAMDAGIEALKRFVKMAELKEVTKIWAVATSAVRESRNGGDFVARARDEVGLNLHVITAEEEARLIYLGVRNAVDLGTRPDTHGLIVDIGGGSVELIVGDAMSPRHLFSAKLGASRLAELFLMGDVARHGEIKRLRRHIRRQLAPFFAAARGENIARCIGTSGSIKSLCVMADALRERPAGEEAFSFRASQAEMKDILSRLIGRTREERLSTPGMDASRVDTSLPAAAVLHAIMDELSLEAVEHCDSALREGVIVDYIGRHRQKLLARATWPNPRLRSVIRLADRCNYRQQHAEQVARLAAQLFEQLAPLHGLDAQYREWLTYACLLHDVGYLIGHGGHHKHSYYLIRNGGLKGFEDGEIEIIANIARYHRKERPKKSHYSFQHLEPAHRKPVRKLSVLLRVANALDRTHYSVVRGVHCRIHRDRVALAVDAMQDAELELWHTRRQAELFEREFDLPLEVRLAGDCQEAPVDGAQAARSPA